MYQTLSSGDFPANPLEKRGYRLDFNDEFDGPDLNKSKWLPFYLPHWSSRALSTPRYSFENGNLVLRIDEDQPPWCPEFDGDIRCSSIQTGAFAGPLGSGLGQQKFNKASVVREAQANVQLYTPHYGYFEMRAKADISAANHVALWMIGYEDVPERSGEINIGEIMGADISSTSSRVSHGIHPWGDPVLQDEFYEPFLPINAANYHIYAADWTPTHIDFYVDNLKITTIHQSPNYPMQFMLSIYERPQQSQNRSTERYPKTFTIDYFRGYQATPSPSSTMEL
jgi:hypothetical protein